MMVSLEQYKNLSTHAHGPQLIQKSDQFD